MSRSRQGVAPQREQLIESHLPLVRAIARRYAGRGETLDDLVQVGSIGLIRASDRFDPRRGVAFATFATPAIEGEIRRHLDDRTNALRIPRKLQRMSGQLERQRTELSASLGRSPTADELARALEVTQEDVERALKAERAREQTPTSPEAVTGAAVDSGSEASTDDRLLLEHGARVLNKRERRIVFLRFHGDLTEREIARELGISQAHVSRLLAGALSKLRGELATQDPAAKTGDIAEKTVISPGEAGIEQGSDVGPETRIADVGAPEKNADLALPYNVTLKPARGDGRSGWIASLKELPGSEAVGATREEAVERLRLAMQDWLSAAVAGQRPEGVRNQPEDGTARRGTEGSKRKATSSHSGRFLVRMPSTLHEELTRAAEHEQVSLNRFVTDALAASLSRPDSASLPPRSAAVEPTSDSPARRRRSFRMLLVANVVVIVFAAVVAVALLVLAFQRGI